MGAIVPVPAQAAKPCQPNSDYLAALATNLAGERSVFTIGAFY
jgi:hypothetical protein